MERSICHMRTILEIPNWIQHFSMVLLQKRKSGFNQFPNNKDGLDLKSSEVSKMTVITTNRMWLYYMRHLTSSSDKGLIRLYSTKSIWSICPSSIILIIPHQNDNTSYCELTSLCKQNYRLDSPEIWSFVKTLLCNSSL